MSTCFPSILFAFIATATIQVLAGNTGIRCEDNLIQWIRSHGGIISDSVFIQSNDIRSRGIFTASPVHINDIVASIPMSLLFTMNDANRILNSIIPQDQKDMFSNLGPIDTLSLALILEHQNTDSFWRPYLECLPTVDQIRNDIQMPMFWSSEDIDQYLQSSKVGKFIGVRFRSLQQSFAEIQGKLQKIPYMNQVVEFTLSHWLWATSIVWSRSFAVMIQHEKVKSLVPFGDLFNFNENLRDITVDLTSWNQQKYARDLMAVDVKSFTSNDGDYFMFKVHESPDISSEGIASGRQLFVEYSGEVLPNFVLFLDYGLCLRDNPMDGMWVAVSDLMETVKGSKAFKNGKIKRKSQQQMMALMDSLDLNRVYVMRSLIGEYYMETGTLSKERQEMLIEPYAFSVFLMSLILNSKNDILLFGEQLMNLKENHPEISSNHDTITVIIRILKDIYKSEEKTTKLIKNTWNTINKWLKSQMTQFDTSLIQDWMIREQLDDQTSEIDFKLQCGLDIRISEKVVLFSVWMQLQRLRNVLLSLLKEIL